LMGLILSPSSFSLPIAIHWLLPDFACTPTKGSLNPKLPLLQTWYHETLNPKPSIVIHWLLPELPLL
jgi:hypothetical protein